MNRGILEAHAAGTVTSTSVMVNTPGFEDAMERARQAPSLGIGLHLNLTAGAPVAHPSRVASLVDPATGRFHPLWVLVHRTLTGGLPAEEVRLECEAQIARARQEGIRLTHLDGHLHVHALPGVWKPVLKATRAAGIRIVRFPLEKAPRGLWSPGALVKQAVVRAAWRLASRGVEVPRHPDYFLGSSMQGGGAAYRKRLLAALDSLELGTSELMVHPGYADAELATLDRYCRQREEELAVLTSGELRQRMTRGDFERIHFGQM